jgi:hypothetical protein
MRLRPLSYLFIDLWFCAVAWVRTVTRAENTLDRHESA